MHFSIDSMNPKNIFTLLILSISSIMAGTIVYSLLATALKLPIAIVMSCLVFSITLLLLGFEKKLIIELTAVANNKLAFIFKMKFQIIYLLAIITVLVLPSIDSQLVAWSEIPIANYLRLLSALMISFLFPGLAILKIVCKNNLSILEKITFSYLISILLLAFFGAYTNLLLIINSALLITSFYPTLKNKNTPNISPKIILNITETTILLLAFLLFSFFAISLYSDYWLFMGPDMWDHYGWTLNILNGIPEIPLVTRSFHNALAGFFQLSGFPLINAWISSVSILFITFLTFYLMSKKILNKVDKRAPIIATIIWSFFSGFAWIYAIFLKNTTQMDWLTALSTALGRTHLDIGYPPGYWTFMGDNPPAAIGFASLFAMIYLVFKKDLNNKTYVFLNTVTFAVGYMLHSVEILFFFVFLTIFIIIKEKTNLKGILTSTTIACSIALLYDYIYQNIFLNNFTISAVFIVGIIILTGSAIGLGLIILPSRKPSPKKQFPKIISIPQKNSIITIILIVLVYVYMLSIIIWLNIKEAYWWGYTLPYRFIPWYFYPIILGPVAILAILAIAWRSNFKTHKATSIMLIATSILLLFSARLITYVNMNYFDTRFNETRMLSVLFIPLAMLASIVTIFTCDKLSKLKIGFQNSWQKISSKRMVLCTVFVAVLLTSGTLSTLMTVDYWTLHSANHPNKVSLSEIEAMDYLRNNTINPIGNADVANFEKVATYTDVSHRVIQTYAGTGTYSPNAFKDSIIFQAKGAEQSLYFFSAYKTDYLYLAQRDTEKLKAIPESFLSNNLDFYKNSFNNSEVNIYEIPQMASPQTDSDTALIVPSFSSDGTSYYSTMYMLAQVRCDYTVMSELEPVLWGKQVLVLPSDIHTPTQTYTIDLNANWTETTQNLTTTIDNNTLKLSINNQSNETVRAEYQSQLSTQIDATSNRYLVWRVYIEDMVADYEELVDYAAIKLYDDEAKDWFLAGTISLTNPDFTKIQNNSWVDVVFDLQSNMWKHQFRNVSKISIMLRISPNSSQTLKTSSLSFYNFVNSNYDTSLLSKIIDWVNNGGTLIVTDTESQGDIASAIGLKSTNNVVQVQEITSGTTKINIPKINVTLNTIQGTNIDVIAKYSGSKETPLAISKKMGEGKIIYFLLEPYLKTMQAYSSSEKSRLFNNLGTLLNLTDLNLPKYQPEKLKTYNASFKEAYLQGAINISSSFIILPENLAITSYNINQTKSKLGNNYLLESIQTNDITNWMITAKNLNLTSNGYGLYSKGKITGDFQVTLILKPDSTVYLNLKDIESGKITTCKISNSASITLTLNAKNPAEFIFRTPKISMEGIADFNNFYLDKVLYSYYSQNVTLNDYVSFDMGLSDVYTFISNLKTNDKISASTSDELWNEWFNVPWDSIIMSQGNLFLIALIIAALVIFYFRQRKHKKS